MKLKGPSIDCTLALEKLSVFYLTKSGYIRSRHGSAMGKDNYGTKFDWPLLSSMSNYHDPSYI